MNRDEVIFKSCGSNRYYMERKAKLVPRVIKQRDSAMESPSKVGRRPAMTPEDREDQLTALAIDLAEKKLRDGTASNQLITYWLARGSTKERLEKEKLEEENKLLRAKTESLQSQQRTKELYIRAIEAMKRYRIDTGDDYEENE